MIPEIGRAILYVASIVASIALAGHLFRLRHTLAKLLGISMAAWAFNSAVLAVSIVYQIEGVPYPEWHYLMRCVDSVLVALVPILLYLGFMKANGDNRT